jgi:hypothetical protein
MTTGGKTAEFTSDNLISLNRKTHVPPSLSAPNECTRMLSTSQVRRRPLASLLTPYAYVSRDSRWVCTAIMYKLLLLKLRDDTGVQSHIAVLPDLRSSSSNAHFGVRLTT